LGKALVHEAQSAIPDSDVILFTVDVASPPDDEDNHIASLVRQARAPVVLALNKSDLLKPQDILANSDAYRALGAWSDWMLVSAVRGDNMDKVLAMLVERLPYSPPLYPPDSVTDQTDRLLVAELVREQALKHLAQEVPHAVEVVVEEWQERPNGKIYIEAHLLVEKESQKGIVIGARAAMLKQIGQAARREIERFLERSVFLELRVKVQEHWRDDDAQLRRLGYEPSS
jgi:GTP-binding protein Era